MEIQQLIVGNTGWVIPPNDSNALAKAINKALKKNNPIKNYGCKERRTVKERIINNFSLEMMTKNYFNCGLMELIKFYIYETKFL